MNATIEFNPALPASPVVTPFAASASIPSRLLLGLVSWLSFSLSLAAMLLTCFNDPYWLTAPSASAGFALGLLTLRRTPQRATGHLAVCLGLCALMLWVVVILFFQHLLGFNLSVEIPKYD